ncbi:clathrin interactor EPSIN 2-like isoform X2 [Tripterygium wilfordii]|uniref:clathrin interactor EPSIN 2-like isoform X2 n=1 Tax=Tripterygium wilfordii TaxID=458696 RepID=UPI0018F83514|nr:clathrin interactor EPSIN 2-like isoform X2 [Tripterygium wilfordii]
MKKAFDQTVRDLKREVNKKVLKVPGIEQKVLDATSNEPWGPHGSLLADIAQASKNYHEYQMIMAVLWKRINDTGKNWRHVYKALIVLEYLVAHGSERVIDEIREHAYQISTLSDFQYIDSSGRDQGSNVRKKSQNLVVLVNDKERIIEVRQKAAVNRDKFRNTSVGGMYRPSSYSSGGGYGDRYDDDRYEGRYGGRDDDRNGYGRERDYSYRNDDRYGRQEDSYSRDGRDYDERYNRDGFRDDDYRGRSRSVDDYQYGSKSRSSDRDRAFDDDGQSSFHGCGAKADDQPQDGRRLERKFSEQNIGAPPSYDEAIGESRSPVSSERDGDTSAASAARAASPTAANNLSQANVVLGTSESPTSQKVEAFDEFDPRGPVTDSFPPNPLAVMPASSTATASVTDRHANMISGSTLDTMPPASTVINQPFEDPFGESPFKAIPSADSVPPTQQSSGSTAPLLLTLDQNAEMPQPSVPNAGPVNNFDFVDSFSAITYPASGAQQPSANSQFLPQELSAVHQEADILADLLPPSGPPPLTVSSHGAFSAPTGQPQPSADVQRNFQQQAGSVAPIAANMGPQAPSGLTSQFNGGGFVSHGGPTAAAASYMPLHIQSGPPAQHGTPGSAAPVAPQYAHQTASGTQYTNGSFLPQQVYATSAAPQTGHYAPGGPPAHFNNGNFSLQQVSGAPSASQIAQAPAGPTVHHNNDVLGNMFSQGANTPMTSQPASTSSTGSLAIVPQSKDKFQTKSAVWNDTLSRGLVNLNISGSKINPLADIGVDFDAINRKEKRMEKTSATPVISTVTMGKAMGSGSGMGRAGAGVLRPPSNPMVSSGMGMGMGGGPGVGMGMGGGPGGVMGVGGGPGAGMGMGGGPGAGMGMGGFGGMHRPMGMGMGMGMNMGQGVHMQQQTSFPPGSVMPGGYNPMMGTGGYPQQPYGGGYK